MLNYAESSFAVVIALAAALFLVAALNRFWPMSNRKLVNDVTGWQLGILGTTYGVILGFMLYTVWTDFRAADRDPTPPGPPTSLLRSIPWCFPRKTRRRRATCPRGWPPQS